MLFFFLDTSKLNKGDQKKLSGAFDPNAQTQFTGGAMFDASGNISKAFLDIFDQNEKDAVDDLQNKYGDGEFERQLCIQYFLDKSISQQTLTAFIYQFYVTN